MDKKSFDDIKLHKDNMTAAERGILVHLILELISFRKIYEETSRGRTVHRLLLPGGALRLGGRVLRRRRLLRSDDAVLLPRGHLPHPLLARFIPLSAEKN